MVGFVDFESRARRGHVFRPLPALVIGVAIADLDVEKSGPGVSLEEVVGPPFHGGQRVLQLALGLKLGAKFDDGPRQAGYGEGVREAELDVVAGVVISSGEINLDIYI